jgi:hypothetical protein
MKKIEFYYSIETSRSYEPSANKVTAYHYTLSSHHSTTTTVHRWSVSAMCLLVQHDQAR